jgi:bacteriorhodopsin
MGHLALTVFKHMNNLTLTQFSLVQNAISFGIAAMGAATLFLWLQRSQVAFRYRTAITISGLVTFIATYHYFRIYESFSSSYTAINGVVSATGHSFNDAYRYVDWLLTVPLLLVELILVMNLTSKEASSKSLKLGSLAALMVLLGYPGEISSDPTTRWIWWALAMIPFAVILYDLFVGLKSSIDTQPENAKALVKLARTIVIVTWSFYPIVFVLPMLGLSGGSSLVAVQIGYTIADVLAKAAFGVFIYLIAVRKSEGVTEAK